MGKATNDGGDAHCAFFYQLMGNIRESYPIVFDGSGGSKPHSKAYRDFAQKWGNIKTLYEISDEKIEKVERIYQLYLNDYLQYLSYMIEKSQVDEEEDKWQDARRRSMKNR